MSDVQQGWRPRSGSCTASSLLGLVLCACAWLHVSEAEAQTAPAPTTQAPDEASVAASARAFFEQGVLAAESGNWAEAEDRFRRALALRASPVLAYNLASALVERGKLVEASEVLRRVQADDSAAPELKQDGARLQEKVTQELGHIAITVQGWQPGDHVLLDGRSVLGAQLGVEMPIDPGSHQLRLERAGTTLDLETVTLAIGDRQHAQLVAAILPRVVSVPPAPLLPPGGLPPSPPPRDEHSSSVTSRWWFWGGLGLLVVAGASVAIVAASAGGGAKPEASYRGSVPPGSISVQVMP